MTQEHDVRNPTSVPIAPLLAERWSPRGFDPNHTLGDEQIASIVESARWAPSMNNTQPWRFILGRRGTSTFERIEAALMPFNKGWTARASALVAFCNLTETDDGKALPFADYDLGQASAYLTMQAEKIGLNVRQMGGLDAAALAASFELPTTIVPRSVAAIGVYSHDPDEIDEKTLEKDSAERTRLPIDELFAVPVE